MLLEIFGFIVVCFVISLVIYYLNKSPEGPDVSNVPIPPDLTVLLATIPDDPITPNSPSPWQFFTCYTAAYFPAGFPDSIGKMSNSLYVQSSSLTNPTIGFEMNQGFGIRLFVSRASKYGDKPDPPYQLAQAIAVYNTTDHRVSYTDTNNPYKRPSPFPSLSIATNTKKTMLPFRFATYYRLCYVDNSNTKEPIYSVASTISYQSFTDNNPVISWKPTQTPEPTLVIYMSNSADKNFTDNTKNFTVSNSSFTDDKNFYYTAAQIPQIDTIANGLSWNQTASDCTVSDWGYATSYCFCVVDSGFDVSLSGIISAQALTQFNGSPFAKSNLNDSKQFSYPTISFKISPLTTDYASYDLLVYRTDGSQTSTGPYDKNGNVIVNPTVAKIPANMTNIIVPISSITNLGFTDKANPFNSILSALAISKWNTDVSLPPYNILIYCRITLGFQPFNIFNFKAISLFDISNNNPVISFSVKTNDYFNSLGFARDKNSIGKYISVDYSTDMSFCDTTKNKLAKVTWNDPITSPDKSTINLSFTLTENLIFLPVPKYTGKLGCSVWDNGTSCNIDCSPGTSNVDGTCSCPSGIPNYNCGPNTNANANDLSCKNPLNYYGYECNDFCEKNTNICNGGACSNLTTPAGVNKKYSCACNFTGKDCRAINSTQQCISDGSNTINYTRDGYNCEGIAVLPHNTVTHLFYDGNSSDIGISFTCRNSDGSRPANNEPNTRQMGNSACNGKDNKGLSCFACGDGSTDNHQTTNICGVNRPSWDCP